MRSLLIPYQFTFAICIVLATVSAQAQPNDKEANFQYQLWVQLCDSTGGLSSSTVEQLEREMRAIFHGAGVDLVWYRQCSMEPMKGDTSFTARVYILEEIPRPLLSSIRKTHGNGHRVLGWSLCQKGEAPGPVVYVSLSAVEELASNRGSDRLTEPQRARALARIVAHELAHRFLRETDHTPWGVLKASYDQKSLIELDPRAFRFTRDQVKQLRMVANRLGP